MHRAASIGWVYDLTQTLAGAHFVRLRLRRHLAGICTSADCVLDIGGGTGRLRSLLPAGSRYICLDLELPKLRRYVSVTSRPNPLQADATRLPVRTASIDVITWTFVAHHFTDADLSAALDESARVLKDGGRILFIDPILDRRRLPGWLLWKLDRGSNPRSDEKLCATLNSRFHVERWDRFAVFHRYLLGIGRKPG